MKELLILRHAKSSWDDAGLDDLERPLSGRGEKDAPKIGAYLAAIGCLPDVIVSSPAQRAAQTTTRMVKAAGYKGVVTYDRRIYLAGPETLIDVIHDLPQTAGRAMLVGHNPGFEELVETLCGGVVRMTTAALACVELPAAESWAEVRPSDGVLLWLVTPKTLA